MIWKETRREDEMRCLEREGRCFPIVQFFEAVLGHMRLPSAYSKPLEYIL
jgi:hypothetical protein